MEVIKEKIQSIFIFFKLLRKNSNLKNKGTIRKSGNSEVQSVAL